MARVTADDWRAIQTKARKFCRVLDAVDSRKRMDGNATFTGRGYGTADVSDDITQDAVLLFAQLLGKIIRKFEPVTYSVATREPNSWLYVTKQGGTFVATRDSIQYTAMRDAARRNGYQIDKKPDDIDATPGAQQMKAVARMAFVAVASNLAANSEAIWGLAFGDGREFPVLSDVLNEGNQADDLGRAGILANVAQKRHGGAYGSRRAVIRTRNAALAEFRELSERADTVREMFAYRAVRDGRDGG
jgi:galactarate dehydratase